MACGKATLRSAKPFTPVQFRAWPPNNAPPFCIQSAESVTRLAPLAAAFKAGSALLYAGLHRAEQAIPR
jgi:hypothetical protein